MNGILRAALVYLTCINLVVMPVAQAETTSWDTNGTAGQGGSITIGTMDPDNPTHPISDKFHYGDRAVLNIVARDRVGNVVGCANPNFEVLNDYGSRQMDPPVNGVITMLRGLGEPRLRVTCPNLPGIVGELHVYNMGGWEKGKSKLKARPSLMEPLPNPLLAPVSTSSAFQPAAPTVATPAAPDPAAAAAAQAETDAAGGLLLAGAVVGGTILLVGAVKGGAKDCSSRNCIGSLSCSCAGSTHDTCTSSDTVNGLGEDCFGGNGSTAYCDDGLTCFNGTCRNNCPL